MSLKSAIQLGIPDAIHKHNKPITLSQLADALSIIKAKSPALFRLMRILVHSKIFDKVNISKDEGEEVAYSLTSASRLLLRDEPLSFAPFALAMIDPFFAMKIVFKTLGRCKEAIKEKGGKVIIVDMVADCEKQEDVAIETQLSFDMLMMAVTTGKERSEKEWGGLSSFLQLASSTTRSLPSVIEKQLLLPKMAFHNVEECSLQELLDAEAHVWNHIYQYINSMSLKCAVQLGIPDVVHKHGKPITLPQLAVALSIGEAKHEALHRLMRILVHSKFFEKVKVVSEEEAYCLTLASHLLLRDEPWSVAPYALTMLESSFMDPLHHLSEWFGNECSSPFVFKHGKTLWEYAGIEQRWNQLFNAAMRNDSRLVASVLVKQCRQVFEGLESVVDVGGGAGTLAKGVADAFPGLKATVLDLPHVVAHLEPSQNLRFVSGDMFHSVPHADAVLLKWILHNWSDEECMKILDKCKEAISGSKDRKGGKLIVIDMILDDKNERGKETETQLLLDVLMMTCLTGKERSEKEWAKLFFAAGFKSYKIHSVLRLRSVIEVFL